MVRVVVIDTPGPRFVHGLALLLAFSLIIPVLLLPFVGLSGVVVTALLFYAFLFLLLLYRPLSVFLRASRIRSVAESISVSGGYFYVPSPLPAEYGYFTVVRRAEGLHRSFTPYYVKDLSQHPLLPESHLVVVDRQGNGKILLPGYRLGGRFSGVLVLFFVPIYAVDFQKTRLSVRSLNDVADVFFRPTDFGFDGYLRHSFSRATEAVTYISWAGSDVAQVLAVSGRQESFTYPIIREPTIIVTHEEYIRPDLLADALGVDALVQGTGTFFVTLRVSFPMEPDQSDSAQVWVSSRVGGLR